MVRFESLCVVIAVSSRFLQSWGQDITTTPPNVTDETTDGSKIFVNPNNNAINYIKPSPIKPTTEQVEFSPGLPPGWTQPPSRPTRPPRPTRTTRFTQRPQTLTSKAEPLTKPFQNNNIPDSSYILDLNLTEHWFQAKPVIITEAGSSTTYPPGVSPPEPVIVDKDPDRGGVVDWFLGLVGIKPNNPENPEQPSVEAPKGCSKCSCGLTYKHNRIVGGQETQVNEYPWMTYLMYNNRFYCGASLINNRYVLTAGHCVNGFAKERLLAVFLDHDRSTSSETLTITRRINKILRHRSYGTGGSYNNDIALLQLQEEVILSGIVKPVCLPAIGKSFSGQTGIVTGWGATQSHGQVSTKLREVKVPIISNPDCKKTGYGERITENMMCAGFTHGTKDSCQGDSGGPLHIADGTSHVIVGIVSWGEGCAQPNYPGVYTRVNRYISWIRSNTKDACYC